MTTLYPRLRGGVLLALVAAAALACGRQKGAEVASSPVAAAAPAKPAPAHAVVPPWVGPYTDEQKNLLRAPIDAPIAQKAVPVYPDLGSFTFLGDSPARVPDDLVGYADVISKTLDDSPLTYVFRTDPDPIANTHALWGPEPSDNPDPWKRVESQGGQPSLVDALPSPELTQKLRAAMAAQKSDMMTLLRQAAATPGAPPGVQAMLADAAIGAGDDATAEKAALAALAIDPRYPHAQRALAEVYLKRGDRDKARGALAHALAAYPRYERAWRVAEVLMGGPIERPVAAPAPFIDVTDAGAVLVVSCDRPMCQGYAACKAAFRFEPAFRASMLREPETTPYHLSATEEVVCLEAGLGAHISARQQGQSAPPDPAAELLVRLAAQRGLSSYAMFEILGQHRPEWLRIAPEPVYQGIVQYVLTHVLGTPTPRVPQPAGPGGPPITAQTAPATRGAIAPGG